MLPGRTVASVAEVLPSELATMITEPALGVVSPDGILMLTDAYSNSL